MINQQPLRGYTARSTETWPPCVIGTGTAIGTHAILYTGCQIGRHCLIGDGVKVREGCRIGDRVRLHWDAQINYDARIGDDTTIGGGCHITGSMRIGARCFFGPGVMTANDPDPRLGYDPARINPPIVGDDVLIGAGAILCPGVHIGNGATIGAGAIVSEDVPAGATVAGVRGRRVASMGTCDRCGEPLDNVAPGFSLIANGKRVCTPCLRAGEEAARARGL